MFDRPRSGERAVLVHVSMHGQPDPDDLQEFRELALSAGAQPLAMVTGQRSAPDKRYYIGTGKAEEVRDHVRDLEAELVIFDHSLSPSQERNLERLFECRVLDRTGLILDIFAQRARSHEGKLQVELAQLRHLATRLVRGWTHLERQKGGIGLRGPGEKQLETDRRLLGKRVALLKSRLKTLERQRAVRRKGRSRGEVLSVSLVGYTNAGKSTLFNALTKAGAYAADQLFATLDTTSRRLYVPTCDLADGRSGCQVVLSDTVGFIRDLPHALVAAFHATLEETIQADLLLHVVDAASPDREQQMAAVAGVLEEIGAAGLPQIVVWNKIDLLGGAVGPGVERDECDNIARVRVSARTGAGLDLLRVALAEMSHRLAAPIEEDNNHPHTEHHDYRHIDVAQ